MRCSVTIASEEFNKYERDRRMTATERKQRKYALMQAHGIPMAGWLHDHSLQLLSSLRYHYGLNEDETLITIYWSAA